MAKLRSAMGKNVDMGALITRNEKVRAVGNMRVNARGDLLDSNNSIVQDATTRINQNYEQTVSQLPQTIVVQPNPIIRNNIEQEAKPIVKESELTEEEKEFEENDEDFKKQ